MVRRTYDCPQCGTYTYEHQSMKEDSLDNCPICKNNLERNLKADADGIYYELDPFMEELMRPEWKAKGKRWRTTNKIKGIDN